MSTLTTRNRHRFPVLAALSGLALTAGLSIASAAPSANAQTSNAKSTPKKGCATGNWAEPTRNRPTFTKGSPQGAYIWHDENGWHLRVTHPGSDLVTFSGVIDSSSKLSEVGRALESSDEVRFQKNKGRVSFEFKNYGAIDGLDFRVGCSNSFTVGLQVNGQPIPNNQVFIGASGTNPLSVPFRAERT